MSPRRGEAVRRPPSMADVAEAAGVSHQTVSRVLNGSPRVREETRERVQEAIRALGYRRNQAARALVTSRSATIGIVTSGVAHVGPARTALAVEAAARGSGYFVALSSLSHAAADEVRTAIDRFLEQGVEGIVVLAPFVDIARVVDEVAAAVPIVVVAAREDVPDGSDVRYVSVDQRAGVRDAVEHLADAGHTRLAHIEGEHGWHDAIARSAGFLESARRRGIEGRVVTADGWDPADGYAAGLELRDAIRRGEVTGVVAGNDHLAIGLIRACVEGGIRVPEDLSVVGFDDIDVAGYLTPALTTVRQPFAELGGEAVRLLLEPGVAAPQPVRPLLVVRDSVAPPRPATTTRTSPDRPAPTPADEKEGRP
ncbi:LacI family DNA-binding transcriptional regulator [Microbacterium sp. gxy059]|uniref:LacI family DNA-binding transcriptional regulator n=1 Tax=Microbacterium sp. gxy059 TaxID=2957199 RepID=UPI003D9A08B0